MQSKGVDSATNLFAHLHLQREGGLRAASHANSSCCGCCSCAASNNCFMHGQVHTEQQTKENLVNSRSFLSCIVVGLKDSEGVPLVSCHRMLEPGSSCHFFSSFFCLAKVIFKSQKQFLILGKLYFLSSYYFFGAPATFWSSCWVLAYGGGSSVRRPLSQPLASWWGSGGLGGSPRSKS